MAASDGDDGVEPVDPPAVPEEGAPGEPPPACEAEEAPPPCEAEEAPPAALDAPSAALSAVDTTESPVLSASLDAAVTTSSEAEVAESTAPEAASVAELAALDAASTGADGSGSDGSASAMPDVSQNASTPVIKIGTRAPIRGPLFPSTPMASPRQQRLSSSPAREFLQRVADPSMEVHILEKART
ncbi:MAG: hypothetical protein M3214_04610 [Actinomycetota bacterium]|nr:hypothetical protein [Actinomycetota bacterium]